MNQYLKVLKAATNNAISYLLAYRVDALMKLLLGLGWTAVNLITAEVLFLHTSAINGWSKPDLLALFMTFGFATEFGLLAGGYIKELETNIRKGTFDGIITKPIDSQFISVFGRPDFSALMYLTTRQIPYIYVLWSDGIETSVSSFFLYLFLLLLANIIWLAVRVLLMTINFWHQKLDNLAELQLTITEFAKYPVGIFPWPIQLVMYTAIPLAFTAFVPAEALRGNFGIGTALFTLLITIIFVLAARLLWNKALRNYTSASS